jgi:hypothetical protein
LEPGARLQRQVARGNGKSLLLAVDQPLRGCPLQTMHQMVKAQHVALPLVGERAL